MSDRDLLLFSIGLLTGLFLAGVVWLIDLYKQSNAMNKGDRRHGSFYPTQPQ